MFTSNNTTNKSKLIHDMMYLSHCFNIKNKLINANKPKIICAFTINIFYVATYMNLTYDDIHVMHDNMFVRNGMINQRQMNNYKYHKLNLKYKTLSQLKQKTLTKTVFVLSNARQVQLNKSCNKYISALRDQDCVCTHSV